MDKDTKTFSFGTALDACKNGAEVTRKAWASSSIAISMKAQFPDENSKMTKPYLYMIKGEDKFPLDLSCESLFAEDWFVTVEGTATGSASTGTVAGDANGSAGEGSGITAQA